MNFHGLAPPRHFTPELLSHFPKAPTASAVCLDLGCGDTAHQTLCERAGFEYVGIDYDAPRAPLLGDAHALPFSDGAFDLVVSLGVLEHLRFPPVAIKEISRVLKVGGRFFGTVAFLEPFHGESYYHCTHLGVQNLLTFGGFSVAFVSPRCEAYNGLRAQARMALFPKMPKCVADALVWPTDVAHKAWFRLGRVLGRDLDETQRVIRTTGTFAFLAFKEQADSLGVQV